MVVNVSSWPLLDLYVSDVVAHFSDDHRLLGWDVMNEPDFGNENMIEFLQHFVALVSDIDTSPTHIVTVGIASHTQQSYVQSFVNTLSFHCYDGAGNGAMLAATIHEQQTIAATLGKAVILTESMGRPGQSLAAVLPAVLGCLTDAVPDTAPVGFFIWELMLGSDQFNDDWSQPYQGLLYPGGAAGAQAGQWWSPDERDLWYNYTRIYGPHGGCQPRPPGRRIVIPDTDDSRLHYMPAGAWTAWTGEGPQNGTLHYARQAGSFVQLQAWQATAVEIVHKVGPDCGIMEVQIDGQAAHKYDTYAREVDWGRITSVATSLPTGPAHNLTITVTGQASPSSSDAYVQLVAVILYAS